MAGANSVACETRGLRESRRVSSEHAASQLILSPPRLALVVDDDLSRWVPLA